MKPEPEERHRQSYAKYAWDYWGEIRTGVAIEEKADAISIRVGGNVGVSEEGIVAFVEGYRGNVET